MGTSADEISAVMRSWLEAVKSGDLNELAGLVTEDVVVIHPDGRAITGRDALKADFARFFDNYRVDQDVTSEETVVSGDWAFDRARVRTTITPLAGGESRIVDSRVLVLLRLDGPGKWRVARTMAALVGGRSGTAD